jgi:hypothetical protein
MDNAAWAIRMGWFKNTEAGKVPENFFDFLRTEEVKIHPVLEPKVREETLGVHGDKVNIKEMVAGGTSFVEVVLQLEEADWFDDNPEMLDYVQAKYEVARNNGMEAQQNLLEEAMREGKNIDNPFN